jgi:beta-lactamase class A
VRRAILPLLLVGCIASAPQVPEGLRASVLAALAPSGGEWGVYFKDLGSGAELAVRADEEFHPASTLKIWVMIKVYQDVHEGRYRLDDEVDVVKTFMSAARRDPKPFGVEPATKEMAAAVGKRIKVRSLVEHMITVSDNLATNNLIRLAGGPREVTACMVRYGVTRSDVRRYIMDDQAFEEGLSSAAFPRDFGLILEKLAGGEVVSRAASREMLEVMSRLKDNDMLPGRLPKPVRVAHKTGAISKVRNDAGLVTLTDGRRYVAAFFSRGLADDKKGGACLAEASRVLYDFVAGN